MHVYNIIFICYIAKSLPRNQRSRIPPAVQTGAPNQHLEKIEQSLICSGKPGLKANNG